MLSLARVALIAVATASFVGVIGGYLGLMHPVGDSLAVFRLPLGLIMLAASILTGHRKLILAALLVAICVLAPRFLDRLHLGAGSDTNFTIYQKNLLVGNDKPEQELALIRALAPDVITLQEVSDINRGLLDALRTEYPYQQFCRFSGWSGQAVLSRHAAVAGSGFCSDGRGLAGLQISFAGQRIWIGSVHLYWPYPYAQAAQVRRLSKDLEAWKGEIVLGGDFNMVPWSDAMRRLMRASRTRRINPSRATYSLGGWQGLAIDHVLTTSPFGAEAYLKDIGGSDHKGWLGRLQFAEE